MSTQRSADAELDVREIDGEPFGPIMDALDDLGDDETLELIAPFEPVPLYAQLEQRGFDHETEEVDESEFHVFIDHA